MNEGAKLAGFFAAHGIWCVSDGGPLIPILAAEKGSGERIANRLIKDELAKAVELGREWLATNHFDASRAVLIADGFVTLESGKTDALIVEMRDYMDDRHSFDMVVPYRNCEHPQGFAVFKPKFTVFPGAQGGEDYGEAANAFFAGVDEHSEGAKVWNAHIDQSQ